MVVGLRYLWFKSLFKRATDMIREWTYRFTKWGTKKVALPSEWMDEESQFGTSMTQSGIIYMLECHYTDRCGDDFCHWPQNWKFWRHLHRLTWASLCPNTVWQCQSDTAPGLILSSGFRPWMPQHTNTSGPHLDPAAYFHRSLGLPQLCGQRPQISAR